MIDVLSDFVPNVHFELIPIKDLVSNQEYQRNLSWTHVKKAVDNFDVSLNVRFSTYAVPTVVLL